MFLLNLAAAALLGATAVSALVQLPATMDPTTGVRPGQHLGSGNSLSRAYSASSIVPSGTRSDIAPTLSPSAVHYPADANTRSL